MFRIWLDTAPHPDALGVLDGVAEIVGPLVHPGHPLADLPVADAVLAGSSFPGDAATFALAPRLRAVCRLGAGHDTIDLAAATDCGIPVTNTPDAPTIATAEFTMLLMLAVLRRLMAGTVVLEAGRWPAPAEVTGTDLAGKTLGIVGLGRIGTRVARLAGAFDMTVMAYDPWASRDAAAGCGATLLPGLDALLPAVDVLTVHVPLSPATQGLIGARELALLRPGSAVINPARGGVVDELALADALRSGHLAGAGIDVWNSEPPPAGHPLIGQPGVVATPHQAGLTVEGRSRSNPEAARQALMILAGQYPPSLLNPEVWQRRRR